MVKQAEVAQEFVDTAVAAADVGRGVALEYFRGGRALGIAEKADASPVTAADVAVQAAMREVILRRHGQDGHGFFGEEGEGDFLRGEGEFCWVVDPIDGTKAFAAGNPLFGMLIALVRGGQVLLGVIEHPALDERWVGVRGRRTLFNGVACAGSDCGDLGEAVVCATTPEMFGEGEAGRFARLAGATRFRLFGGDCYQYGLLARGFVEVVCEAGMQAHDYLALIPVVEGAGGVISDWEGAPLAVDVGGEVVGGGRRVLACANAGLQRAAVGALGELGAGAGAG